MHNFIVQSLTIPNHPLRKLSDGQLRRYISGLGEFLCYITRADHRAKIIFEAWSMSLLGRVPGAAWSFTSDFSSVQDCLLVYGKADDHDTRRYTFLFDCLYLLEKTDPNLIFMGYSFLRDRVKGKFTEGMLEHVFDIFRGDSRGEKVDGILKRHRRTARKFAERDLKRVLVAATMSAGKSTLVNALVGHSISRMQTIACTSRAHYLYNKPAAEGAFATFGNRNNLIYTCDYSLLNHEAVEHVGLRYLSSLGKERICIIDTPGVNFAGDKSHGETTRSLIAKGDYDLLVIVLNGTALAIDDEKDLMTFVGKNCRKRVIAVVNKCDLFSRKHDSIQAALATAEKALRDSGIKPVAVVPVSAYAALLSRLNENPGYTMDEDDIFDLKELERRMANPYYCLPAYLPGVPPAINLTTALERSAVPYLEKLIKEL